MNFALQPIYSKIRLLLVVHVLFFISSQGFAQCSSIHVTVDTNKSCAPGIFTFVAHNIPKSSIVHWDFGKGDVLGKDTFRFIETDPKTINLTLTVNLPGGSICTKTYKTIVQILAPPKPKMVISKKFYCNTTEGFKLTDNTPGSAYRIWTIEGNNYGDNDRVYSGNFTGTGKKDIFLMVEDSFGCRGVTNFPEIAEVLENHAIDIKGGNTTACINSNVTFSMTGTLSTADVKSAVWRFEGATIDSSTKLYPQVKYPKGGLYDVELEVETNKGCMYSVKRKEMVRAVDTIVLDVDIRDSILCLPNREVIVVKNKGLYGTYDWDVEGYDVVDTLAPTVMEYSFPNVGVYGVKISYTDSFCTSHYYGPRDISTKRVIAHALSAQHYDCEVPFVAAFTNGSTSSDPGKMWYRWQVFDTTGKLLAASSDKNFQYIVKEKGYYDLELAVRHENGCGDTSFHSQLIRADSIRIAFVTIPKLACLNQNVLIGNQTLPASYRASEQFEWFLYKHGDTSNPIATSNAVQPQFQATYDGSYDILVKAKNAVGCKQELFREEAFKVIKPRASFFAQMDTVCRGDTFKLESTVTPQDGNFQHNWMATNGQDSFYWQGGSQPEIWLQIPGVYDIRYDISIYGLCRDTAYEKAEVVVSGIYADIDIPSKRTCRGVDFVPEAKVANKVYGSTNDTVRYEWKVIPSGGFTIQDEESAKPKIKFFKNGEYVIRLIARNDNHCNDTAFSDTITVGFDPTFQFADTTVCAKAPIEFYNFSNTYANRWFYNIQPSVSHTMSGLGKDTSVLSIDKTGDYMLNIIPSRDSMCFDTFSIPIHIVSPVAAFHALDSNLYCAPVYQRFRSTSLYTDTLFWDFGAGNKLKTTSHKVTTVYLENTGDINPYTVSLIAKNKSGCSDTLVKKEMIKITGPAVIFELDTNRGCEPLSVTLKGKTDNVAKMFIDYGDGGPFGYDLGTPHEYLNKWRIIEQQYRPAVLVVDKNGCQTAIKSDSIVYVKPSPKAIIGLTDSVSCIPLQTQYFYLGQEAKTWSWDFEGDGIPDGNNASGKFQYTVPGRYNLTLTNLNDFGCGDTAIREVHAVGAPKVNIGLNGRPCVNKLLELSDLTILDTTLQSRTWTVTDVTGTSVITDVSFVLTKSSPQEIFVRLEVVDEVGCAGRDSVSIEFISKKNTEPAEMEVITVSLDTVIGLQAVIPGLPYRISEVFKEDGSGQMQHHLDKSPAISNWLDTLNMPVAGPVCYEIQHLDSCDFRSQASNRHCTIFLEVSSTVQGQNMLTWTPYVGWSTVSEYDIFKKEDGDFELLTSVAGDVNEYVDTALCEKTYCYYVVAKHPTEDFTSRSNQVCSKPLYLPNTSNSHIEYVTVVDNSSIEVKVLDDAFGRHIIEKRVDGVLVNSFEIDDDVYEDLNVDVGEKSYLYQVRSVDHCNSAGELGREGKSILLDAYVNDKIVFTWTPYREWETGVDRYEIHRQIGSAFEKYKTVSGQDTLYTSEISGDIGSSNCFVVVAYNDGEGVKSRSNVQCLEAKAIVFVPNAFTPNAQGGNDEFKPLALFIKNPANYPEGLYDLQIYNRWGELIFQTNDPEKGWDGTVGGKPSPVGAYVYTFRTRGLDNQILNFSGTVTLIR